MKNWTRQPHCTRRLLLACGALCLAAGGVAGSDPHERDGHDDREREERVVIESDIIELKAVIRDFRAKSERGGHADFQSYSGTTTIGLVADELDAEGKPVVASLRGQKITSEFKDSEGRHINPALYEPDELDRGGRLIDGPGSNGLTSVMEFNQWYRDVPGVNMSTIIPLTLNRVEGTDRFVFDSVEDEPYDDRGGFFPINGELFGNYAHWDRNYHFTTEIETRFTYRRDTGLVFKFTGDDDVWVFIDGKLVIDLGGLHPKREQSIELDRLEWLEDGETYSFKIFHAERRTSGSNFRIETTMKLIPVQLPPVSSFYD